MEDKRILIARQDIPSRCRIGSNIKEFFAEVATDAEIALLDTLARRTVADSLTELLRLDGIRTKRLTIEATTRRAKLLANGVKRT
jgi:Rrf2 family transcriptional repressor of oqxAB